MDGPNSRVNKTEEQFRELKDKIGITEAEKKREN